MVCLVEGGKIRVQKVQCLVITLQEERPMNYMWNKKKRVNGMKTRTQHKCFFFFNSVSLSLFDGISHAQGVVVSFSFFFVQKRRKL
jgi:hypothetical protein